MRRSIGLMLTLLAVALSGAANAPVLGAESPGERVPKPRAAIEPVAPVLPAEAVAALQERRFQEALKLLDRAEDDPKATADQRAYFALVRGVALRLGGKLDDARTTLKAALKAHSDGPWTAKLRGELAAVELADRQFAAAEALARTEAERLLEPDRKDRLASVYQTFAQRLLKPDEPTTPADPEGAYALLNQARDLAQGETLRARLRFEMGRASQQAGNPGRAIEDFRAYLADFPQGADRAETRFHLGEAQLAAGQTVPARLTWIDLARDLEKQDSKTAAAIRADALYQIPRTFQVPTPPDDAQLGLGIAAIRRALDFAPGHKQAVRAAYQIGASYLARGQSQKALEALTTFLKGDGYEAQSDEARKDLAELRMTAQFQVGQILQGQEKFSEAIDAFRGYLAQYPDGPQSADAQRAILDTQLLIAADHLRHERYDQARTAWHAFVTQNPLDARVPQLLFQIGESFVTQEKYDQALAAWEILIGKFPGTEPAAHAQYQAALVIEAHQADPEAALERYKKVSVAPWQALAQQRVAILESKALTVVTPRAFRSGETARLCINTRNIEKLTFSAYKLDPETYFRKKLALRNVEALDIGLVAPDAEWTVDVPDFGKYRPIEKDYDLKPIALPGVWVVKVTDEKTLQATTLVLGSDLEAIVKTSRDQVLVFAQDMKTGEGRDGARVLIADGSGLILEAKTGEDGVLLRDWPKPRDPNSGLTYLVLDGAQVAGSGLGVPGQVAQGLSPRAYLYTDRPAYRPGQEVGLRGVVREVKDGQYAHQPGASYRLEVADSRGRLLVSRTVTLSEFGTFHQHLTLDDSAPLGSYRIRLYQPGKSDFSGRFEVQSYQLEKIDLTWDLPRTVYYRGETITADVVAKYQYGTPLAERPIEVSLPDGRILQGQTNAAGQYHVELPTEGFAEEQALTLSARLPQDNVAATASVSLAVRAFRIDLSTPRDVYLDGETFALTAKTLDAMGEPTGQELSISVLKRVEQAGRTSERETDQESLKTDSKTGSGVANLSVEDTDGGRYTIRATGTDRFGNPVVAERALTISGRKDEQKLRLLAERTTYKVGEAAEVRLHNRAGTGPALLAWEADRILSYKLVNLKEGDNSVTWDVSGPQFPNFSLTASRMSGTDFHQARLDLRVERDLRVEVQPTQPTVGPGSEVEVEIRTTDQLGHPVSAELSLALVDQALLRIYGDTLPAIGPFFYGQERRGAFATEATNTFRYAPRTVAVPEAVVEEAERALAQAANQQTAADVLKQAQSQVNFSDITRTRNLSFRGGMGGMGGGGFDGMALGLPAGASMPAMNAPVPLEESSARENDRGFFAGGRLGSEGRDEAGAARSLRFGASLADIESFEWKAKDALGEKAAPPRQRFVETAYWDPSVVTGPDGRARVTFPAPMALSRYQFTARGVTGAETLAGQATADLQVQKNFFVDLKTPPLLTQGDKPRFSAQVYHQGVAGPFQLRLTVYAGGREIVQPKTIDPKGDGVEEVLFDPIEVADGDVVRLTLQARTEEASDELTAEVPIRPWGVQAFASASGTARDDTTALVSLPAGRSYEQPEMLITLAPTVKRMIVELALNEGPGGPVFRNAIWCPVPADTLADRASDLLAATAALEYLKATRTATPDVTRLADRIRGQVSELVAAQNEDGGWPWIGGQEKKPSDRLTSARVAWALASAVPHGLLSDPAALDRSNTYLTAQLAATDASDHETRAALLHALSTRDKATFEQANALNRSRQSLPDAALAYLALTFANLKRPELAGEVLGILGPRSKTEPASPGGPIQRSWSGESSSPWHRNPVESTALAALAWAAVRPGAAELAESVAWLEAHRQGFGWTPHKAQGPALAALAAFYGRANAADDRYHLVVTVNDTEVLTADVTGSAEGKEVLVPRAALKEGAANRVHFDIEGRGTFGYSVTLTGFARDFGPDQRNYNHPFRITRRAYLAADPELDGKVLPVGFGVAVNAQGFENTVSQVPLGGRARVRIDAWRNQYAGQPAWQQDFLILEEPIPAGATLVEGSVQSQAIRYELADGVLRFYFAPGQWIGVIQYDVYGYLPGQYRALPPKLASAYEPGRFHLGPEGQLTILAPGEKSTDPYKATPDELYARGKAHFEAHRLDQAAAALEELFAGYTLRDDVLKDTARMLLACDIARNEPRKIVRDFEVLKERAPELVIPFDQIRAVGHAYADIGENERAYLVWRATAEASQLEDAQVGQVLQQRGQTLEGIAYLLDLWREYPGGAALQSDLLGLAQLIASKATAAPTDPALRHELTEAGVTRPELFLQSIRLLQVFLSLTPTDPQADEASLALIGAFLELEDHAAVVKLAQRFAALYPKSPYQDSFQYSEALGRFHLGEYDRAIAVAEAIARATYQDANGVDQPSPNKWQALYILGQIYDARRQPARALSYYEQVSDRFSDAASAVQFLTREALELPEVAVIHPGLAPKVADTVPAPGFRAVPAERPDPVAKPGIELSYRNIAQAEVTVYPVDLMRLYLTRRNLAGISSIDLAGITPLAEKSITLGDGSDFADKEREIELPLEKEGAYLVMVRGDEHYASGIVLVSPLELEVLEEPAAGRVRVTVRNAATGDPVPKVQVKVIGTENPTFLSGETDLRGVFVAEGVRGQVTAVARQDAAKYAFHRGSQYVGQPPSPASGPAQQPQAGERQGQQGQQALDSNVQMLNSFNRKVQIERLQQRYGEQGQNKGVQVQQAK